MQQSINMQKPELISPACFGKCVLLIDPDEVNYVIHKFYFKKNKLNLQYSKSLRHAIWMVQENPPDLILSEVFFNGKIEYGHLYLFQKEKNIPIIVQSNQPLDKYEEDCAIRGAIAYFTKPLDWYRYLKMIEKCLVLSELEDHP